MTALRVQVYPVSFVLEAGPPRFVALGRSDGSSLIKSAGRDPDATARALLDGVVDELARTGLATARAAAREELRGLVKRVVALAGAAPSAEATTLIYTAALPLPLAEPGLDISVDSPFEWRTISESRRRNDTRTTQVRSGPDAIVLDYWRQAFEETDTALDFLPRHLSMLQLRGLYDAIWGYDQDPSGFKRWAIDRKGAFRDLLQRANDHDIEADFYKVLADQVPGETAALAGATAAEFNGEPLDREIGLAIGLAAAMTANRLYSRRGPEPAWFRKTDRWRHGPTWIENVYPPRPAWTRWDIGQEHARAATS
jgi:hypothetical protein